ncbi:hypothetical protein DPMN_146802 [Dreissena polymorpha]|uniref:Uncharacterized protein n=1 Tax=Dreissena polymorpha TaxID=45954 RepID=A0A9D4J019_DREPO|nr:hypothetical protein DPMN_146802 [Dreissena polymorpha]
MHLVASYTPIPTPTINGAQRGTNVRRKDQVGGWTRFQEGCTVGTTFIEDGITLSEWCWIREHDNQKEAG